MPIDLALAANTAVKYSIDVTKRVNPLRKESWHVHDMPTWFWHSIGTLFILENRPLMDVLSSTVAGLSSPHPISADHICNKARLIS